MNRTLKLTISDFSELWAAFSRQKLPPRVLLFMCLNLVVAPAVQATTGNEFSRTQAYALGLLGLVTVALSIYLFFVMFAPEKF